MFCVIPEGMKLDGDFDCLELMKAITASSKHHACGTRPSTSLCAQLSSKCRDLTRVSTL